MGRIHLLEDDVINKIAAGEVVERPASVVKELVENALDAGATDISIDLGEGGCALISVTDNGSGMSADDMVLAVTRHATSKIANVDDLFKVQSMGFRGEALASIAAVSKFTIATRQPNEDVGRQLVVEGGVVGKVEPKAMASHGTCISVENLFYNLPARAAFLKSAGAEYTQTAELIRALALAKPGIRFSVRHNRKDQMLFPAQRVAAGDAFCGEDILKARFAAVIDDVEMADKMLYVQRADDNFQWEALLSPPGFERMNSKGMYLFVNDRWVKDQALRYALMRGYHSHLLKGRYPLVMLRLTVNPALVDVNVHPAKTEIRLQYAGDIHTHISTGVRDRLRKADFAAAPIIAEPARDAYQPMPRAAYTPPATRIAAPTLTARTRTYEPMVSREESLATVHEHINWQELSFIGTYGKLYLMFDAGERMLVVDQHAFHERILFERLMSDPTVLGGSQRLLVPESISLTAEQRDGFEQMKSHLHELGFELVLQGETDLEIHAVPALLTKRDPMSLLTSVLEQVDASAAEAKAQVAHLTLATIACHAAVRGGEELTQDDLTQLISQASTVDFYHNCPHGRRVFKWWSKQEISRWFDR